MASRLAAENQSGRYLDDVDGVQELVAAIDEEAGDETGLRPLEIDLRNSIDQVPVNNVTVETGDDDDEEQVSDEGSESVHSEEDDPFMTSVDVPTTSLYRKRPTVRPHNSPSRWQPTSTYKLDLVAAPARQRLHDLQTHRVPSSRSIRKPDLRSSKKQSPPGWTTSPAARKPLTRILLPSSSSEYVLYPTRPHRVSIGETPDPPSPPLRPAKPATHPTAPTRPDEDDTLVILPRQPPTPSADIITSASDSRRPLLTPKIWAAMSQPARYQHRELYGATAHELAMDPPPSFKHPTPQRHRDKCFKIHEDETATATPARICQSTLTAQRPPLPSVEERRQGGVEEEEETPWDPWTTETWTMNEDWENDLDPNVPEDVEVVGSNEEGVEAQSEGEV